MAFDEIQFPVDISYGASGGPAFNTTVVIAKSGQESRNQNWTEARVRWDVSTGIQSRSDIRKLLDFFRNRRGRARGFRFKDWTDFDVSNELIATADGTATTYQLRQRYDDGLTVSSRIITKPIGDTVSITLDDVPQTTGWSVDSTTGVVTFDTAPAFGVSIRASFEFDLPARFDSDSLSITLTGYDGWNSDSIMVVELRGEDAINTP